MKKVLSVGGVFVFVFLLASRNSFSTEKRTAELYELCNSTSTPPSYKQILKQHIDRRADILNPRAKAASLSARKHSPRVSSAVRIAGVSSVSPLAADPGFKLGEVYCYPNPAKKTNPSFHIETGMADKVELKVYDTAGDLVHETVLPAMPQVIDDGQGPQYAYEYLWETKNAGSGVYVFSVTAKKGDKTLRKSGRCAVIK